LSVLSRRGGLVHAELLDVGFNLCRELDVDSFALAFVGHHISLGEVEARSQRCLVRVVHYLERSRIHGERRAQYPLGNRFQPHANNEDDRGQPVSQPELDGHAGLDGVSDFGRVDYFRSLPGTVFVSSHTKGSGLRGGALMEKSEDHMIIFEDVSKFYGEILGVNRVSLTIEPGITSLVGPNGSGKTTLMNLMTGLIRPTRGRLSVLGLRADHPEVFFK